MSAASIAAEVEGVGVSLSVPVLISSTKTTTKNIRQRTFFPVT